MNRSKWIRMAIIAAVLFLSAMVSNAQAGRGYGMGPGGGDGGTMRLYDSQFTSVHFSGSGNCTRCHNGLTDQYGLNVSIETFWSSTMMANASRDPVWKAKVKNEINQNPLLASIINNKCSRCHTPMAHTEALHQGDEIKIFNNGFLNSGNTYFDEAMDAVSCTLCHQIADSTALGTLDGFSGHYEIQTFANAVDREIYGPYSDVFVQPMRNNVQYTIGFSSHNQESETCATCHNLKTPYVDENGKILSTTPESEFPEQMPYSEWEHSDYVDTQSCQDCHMARADGVAMSTRPRWLNTRDNFAIHNLAGANTLMLDILAQNKTALGVTSSNFDYTMLETDLMLQGAADIGITQRSFTDGELDFTLEITTNTGHKLPSGIPFRRIILHVVVKDDSGNVVFESGKINGDGSITGVEPLVVEPHYDVIDSTEKVQVYETMMSNNFGDLTFTLLRSMDYIKDNRLLPIGFDKYNAPDDIKVAGRALTDPNFIGGGDQITYHISELAQESHSVTVELIYQPLSNAFIQDLFQDPSGEVSAFQSMYARSDKKSTIMTSRNFNVDP